MKRLLLLVLIACGGPAKTAVDTTEEVAPTGGRAGEECVSSACEQGLVCKTGRGSTLCYPQTWFTGEKNAFCFTDADCHPSLGCDLAAANPFTNGVCVVVHAPN